MNKKLEKTLKLITIFTLIVSFTMSMTGCSSLFQQNMQSIIPTNKEPTKLGDGNSDTGIFDGERYEELPTINHRTEEEIAATGLTAQDVLNAYDQLATDIMRLHYSDSTYNYIPQEMAESLVAKFESISTWRHEFYNTNTHLYEFTACPFYAFDPNYLPQSDFAGYNDSIPNIPAYVITLSMECYIDGVVFDRFKTVGVEENQFEQTMTAFGQKSFFLEHDTFMEKLEQVDDYNDFSQFYNQKGYEPMEISRETIMNATPEQLKAIYTMISSIRSIGFEHKLP